MQTQKIPYWAVHQFFRNAFWRMSAVLIPSMITVENNVDTMSTSDMRSSCGPRSTLPPISTNVAVRLAMPKKGVSTPNIIPSNIAFHFLHPCSLATPAIIAGTTGTINSAQTTNSAQPGIVGDPSCSALAHAIKWVSSRMPNIHSSMRLKAVLNASQFNSLSMIW